MKIEAVTVCVNYSDFLAWFLLSNAKLFDRLVVVTDTKDRKTADLCEHHHVECVKTDVFYKDGLAFDKGAGINQGLARLDRDAWVAHIDADIVLPPRSRALLEAMNLDPAMIYGIDRMLCTSFADWIAYITLPEVQHSLNAFVQATAFPLGTRVASMGGGDRADDYVPIGFFQLWNPRVSGQMVYGNHSDAGRGDFAFGQNWPRAKRALLPEIVGIHLESEPAEMAANWRGRRTRTFGPEHAPKPAPNRPA
jgi:hypothetical protein